MSSRCYIASYFDLNRERWILHDEILRIIDGFDYVTDGNLGVLHLIDANRSQLVNYPRFGCAAREDIVGGINLSINNKVLDGFPKPPRITVQEAVQVAKALDRRKQLANKYEYRCSSTSAQAILTKYDLDLTKAFHNRFVKTLEPGRP